LLSSHNLQIALRHPIGEHRATLNIGFVLLSFSLFFYEEVSIAEFIIANARKVHLEN